MAQFESASFCALADGNRAILHKKNGPTPEFEEGHSYIIKNCTLARKTWAALCAVRSFNIEI